MEKLTEKQREAIKKSSTVSLVAKLIKIGKTEEELSVLDRDALMHAWAQVVVEGKDKPPAAVMGAEVKHAVGYDVELERERLAFEKLKFDKEMEMEKLRLEREKEKLDLERLRLKKDEEEEGKAVELRREELQRQKDRDKAEKDRLNSPVYKAKLFGDALRGTMSRMPQDAVELVPYFRNVEQLFSDFKVEPELKAHLLKPHLSDQARVLIARMDPAKASSYDEIKKFLLREYKLSAAALLEKYNSLKREAGETYTLYGNRMKSILLYYVESRKAMGYELLIELLVCDRMKSLLSYGAMQYILSLENQATNGWLRLDDLVTALDRFYATHTDSDKPRFVSDAVANQAGSSFNSSNTTSMHSVNYKTPPPRPPPPRFGANKKVAVAKAQPERDRGNDRKCFICGSRFHLQSYHKRERTNSQDVKVKACVTESSARARVDAGVQ